MKKWSRPEVRVFGVKMDENIASSGTQSSSKLAIMHQKTGTMAGSWPVYTYYVSAGNTIVDTSVTYMYTASSGNSNYYTLGSEDAVAGCLA